MNPQTILDHVQEAEYRPGKVKDLARALGVPQPEYRAFRQAIKELERCRQPRRERRLSAEVQAPRRAPLRRCPDRRDPARACLRGRESYDR